MVEEKRWYHSRTIWGSILAVGASLAGTMGVTIDNSTQVDLADSMLQFVGAIGAMVAIYGRLSATEVIS